MIIEFFCLFFFLDIWHTSKSEQIDCAILSHMSIWTPHSRGVFQECDNEVKFENVYTSFEANQALSNI